MKKRFLAGLSAVLVAAMLAGCGGGTTTTTTPEATTPEGTTPATSTEAPAGDAKTGVASITTIDKSKDAAEEDGLVQVDSLIAAVIVDKDGKIANAKIDAAQTKINFSKEGKILTDLATIVKSKHDLGEEYGMKKASGIAKEWNEQAIAFADYVKGKTMEEVKGMALDEEGRPAADDLKASVTVHVNDFIAVLDMAVANAQDLGASATDKLGMDIETSIAKSVDAGDEDGLAQTYSLISVATLNAEGQVTSAYFDGIQSNINFSKEGKMVTPLDTKVDSKQVLKDAYGMKANSGIGKEWYEQIIAFADYIKGKTVEEIKGIKLDEEGRATDEDLKSAVTVHVIEFVDGLDRLSKTAK